MRGIEAPLWNPGPLLLEPRRKSFPRNWMKALPLALRQSVNIQPGQGNGTTGSPHLQRLKLMQRFVKQSREMGLVASDLLQGLLVWEEPLTTHSCQILLYPLCGRLGTDYL